MSDGPKRYILASASPRRVELLKLILPEYEVIPADIDETLPPRIDPVEAATRLSVKKAKAVFEETGGDAVVIGADTVVEIEGYILGKPADAAEAAGMLSMLSERRHRVHTGVGIFAPGVTASFTETTDVWVGQLSTADIEAYIATGEPFDKAGGYGIQGSFSRFVPRIEGCYFSVVGLPVARLYDQLTRLGLL